MRWREGESLLIFDGRLSLRITYSFVFRNVIKFSEQKFIIIISNHPWNVNRKKKDSAFFERAIGWNRCGISKCIKSLFVRVFFPCPFSIEQLWKINRFTKKIAPYKRNGVSVVVNPPKRFWVIFRMEWPMAGAANQWHVAVGLCLGAAQMTGRCCGQRWWGHLRLCGSRRRWRRCYRMPWYRLMAGHTVWYCRNGWGAGRFQFELVTCVRARHITAFRLGLFAVAVATFVVVQGFGGFLWFSVHTWNVHTTTKKWIIYSENVMFEILFR